MPIYPFAYQSQDISFVDWTSLYTLCLAPLIMHLISGAPRPSFLVPGRPKWHHRIVLYNPSSILWRYAAITDRRIRARKWRPLDMAASNALFWTKNGWDGSDDMVTRSFPHCTHIPEHARVQLVSVEMLKTVIITVQGAQAAIGLLGNLVLGDDGRNETFNVYMAVDNLFGPLAIFGLLRLCAALWLTDDFAYTVVDNNNNVAMDNLSNTHVQLEQHRRVSIDSLIGSASADNDRIASSGNAHYHPTSHWPSRLFRTIYLLLMVACLVLAGIYIIPAPGPKSYSTTTFLLGTFYFGFMFATVAIYTWYFVRHGSTTTIIPCITHIWYKVYTLFVMSFMVVLIIVASLETVKTPCGIFTTMPVALSPLLCESKDRITWAIDGNDTTTTWNAFALAFRRPRSLENGTVLMAQQFWVGNATGTCIIERDESRNFHWQLATLTDVEHDWEPGNPRSRV